LLRQLLASPWDKKKEPLGFLGGHIFEKFFHFKKSILSKPQREDKAQPNIEYPIATTGAY